MGCCNSKKIKVEDVGEKESSNEKVKSDDPVSNGSKISVINIQNMQRESSDDTSSIEPKIDQETSLNDHSIKESDNDEQENKSIESEYDSSVVIVKELMIKKIKYVDFDNNSNAGSGIEQESMSIENDESESEQIFDSEEEISNSQSSPTHSTSDDSDLSLLQQLLRKRKKDSL